MKGQGGYRNNKGRRQTWKKKRSIKSRREERKKEEKKEEEQFSIYLYLWINISSQQQSNMNIFNEPTTEHEITSSCSPCSWVQHVEFLLHHHTQVWRHLWIHSHPHLWVDWKTVHPLPLLPAEQNWASLQIQIKYLQFFVHLTMVKSRGYLAVNESHLCVMNLDCNIEFNENTDIAYGR